jgi:predicted RNase H-like HicB family nuclease
MTAGKTPEEADWKLVVRGLKKAGTAEARVLMEKALMEAGGLPLKLREARRRLFVLTTSACKGRPAIVEAEGGLVFLIALDDLVEVVMERGPTLDEVMRRARAAGRHEE